MRSEGTKGSVWAALLYFSVFYVLKWGGFSSQLTRDEGIYMSSSLSGISDHGTDNSDQNEESVDGK